MYVQQAPRAANMAHCVSLSKLCEHDGAWVGDVDGAEVGAPVVGDTVVGSEVVGNWVGSVVGRPEVGSAVGSLVVGSEVVGASVT